MRASYYRTERQPHRAPHPVIQAVTSEGLAQGPYVADRGEVEPATFRTEDTEHHHSTERGIFCEGATKLDSASRNPSPRPCSIEYYETFSCHCSVVTRKAGLSCLAIIKSTMHHSKIVSYKLITLPSLTNFT